MTKQTRLGLFLLVLGLLLGASISPGFARSGAGVPYAAPTRTASATPIPILPVVTVTPGADGQLTHTVQYGETLITIAEAYGLTVPELKQLNGLQADSIYVGQKLLVRTGETATATTEATKTATATRRPTATQRPPEPTPTKPQPPTSTPTPTPVPFWTAVTKQMDRQTLGYGLIAVCAVGLVLVGITGFRGKK